jgi:hypothetical protein
MASNCVETASNGLDPDIADVVVDVDKIPRCSAVAPSASATTCTSEFPPYGGRIQPLPPTNACNTPVTRQPSRPGRFGRYQQQQQMNDDDQTIISGSARRSRSTHPNTRPVGVVLSGHGCHRQPLWVTWVLSLSLFLLFPAKRRRCEKGTCTQFHGSAVPHPSRETNRLETRWSPCPVTTS